MSLLMKQYIYLSIYLSIWFHKNFDRHLFKSNFGIEKWFKIDLKIKMNFLKLGYLNLGSNCANMGYSILKKIGCSEKFCGTFSDEINVSTNAKK